jgi:hypothetical protein
VTTVGYGNIVPDQTAGKIIAAFLMLGGLSLIAVVTTAIASGFVSRADAQRQVAGEDPVMQKLEEIAAEPYPGDPNCHRHYSGCLIGPRRPSPKQPPLSANAERRAVRRASAWPRSEHAGSGYAPQPIP